MRVGSRTTGHARFGRLSRSPKDWPLQEKRDDRGCARRKQWKVSGPAGAAASSASRSQRCDSKIKSLKINKQRSSGLENPLNHLLNGNWSSLPTSLRFRISSKPQAGALRGSRNFGNFRNTRGCYHFATVINAIWHLWVWLPSLHYPAREMT